MAAGAASAASRGRCSAGARASPPSTASGSTPASARTCSISTTATRRGIIGAIAKTLGDADVNIATFHLGRTERGGAAVALVEVDQPVPDPLAAALRALPGIARVKRLRFRSG